jgi:hypothetical protein
VKAGRREEREVIQTRDGSLDRLFTVNGHPLTAAQQRKENDRIQQLLHDPSEQQELKRDAQKDDEQMTRMLNLLPQALLFSYGARRGDSVQFDVQAESAVSTFLA